MFDPTKLLVDFTRLDSRFQYDAHKLRGVDTAALVPKAVVPAPRMWRPAAGLSRGLIYDWNVRSHPGTSCHRALNPALAHPASSRPMKPNS
jgi:hypothetical protein